MIKKLTNVQIGNIVLLGICTGEKDYKLAWLINNSVQIRLKKESDLVIETGNSSSIKVSNFKFETEHCIFHLLFNKLTGGSLDGSKLLLKELSQFDYLFVLNMKSDTLGVEEIENAIKKNSTILFVQRIDISKIKEKENLIF